MKNRYIEYIKTSHNHDKSTSKSLFMVAFYLRLDPTQNVAAFCGGRIFYPHHFVDVNKMVGIVFL